MVRLAPTKAIYFTVEKPTANDPGTRMWTEGPRREQERELGKQIANKGA